MLKFFYPISLTFLFIIFCNIAFASTYQTSDGRLISYTDIGHGKPLVLIHAFPTDQQLWHPQQQALKQKFRVITLDLWGFGRSSAVNGQAVSMTDYADEIIQLLDQLHIKKAIIAGESMGGYIALALLAKNPDKIDGLVLSDTQSIADTEEIKAKREAAATDVLEHGTNQLIQNFMSKALSPEAPVSTKKFLQKILETQTPTAIASALRGMALRSDTSNLLSNTQLPILIITGDQDTLISPQQSQHMHALARNSKLAIITHAAHLSSLEQSEQWNHTIITMFFDRK